MTNHAKRPSGSHSRRLGGNHNSCSRAQSDEVPRHTRMLSAPDGPRFTQQPPRNATVRIWAEDSPRIGVWRAHDVRALIEGRVVSKHGRDSWRRTVWYVRAVGVADYRKRRAGRTD